MKRYRQPPVGADLSQPTPDLSGRPRWNSHPFIGNEPMKKYRQPPVGADLSQPTPDLSGRPRWNSHQFIGEAGKETRPRRHRRLPNDWYARYTAPVQLM